MNAKITLDRDFSISPVDPRLFGGFIEHLGRHIYGGIFEPEHPDADARGFRTDVIELVRELGMPVMRYPGGNFISGYNWEDTVGPRDQRPVRLDLAWRATETNAFGLNEFMDWSRCVGTEPILAVNLGTRGADAARNLVEYCNHPGGTAWSDLRRAHGYETPHGIKYWCLGNEMDGPWQMGHKTAEEYGRAACEAAKLMKLTDPGISLVACGSSHRQMPTFIDWEETVLGHTFDHVDYISIHTYWGNREHNTPLFLARADAMDAFIEEVTAACDAVSARRRSRKRIMLSFDEWNVWYHSLGRKQEKPWPQAPRQLEDIYNFEDALCVGGMLISLLNHADRVKIGCLAQVVNVIAPIFTEPGGPAWRQTIFHPFALASRYARGTVLRQHVVSPVTAIPEAGDVPDLKSACVWKPESGELALFLLNRNVDRTLTLEVEPRGFGDFSVAEWTILRHADLYATNSTETPDAVAPSEADGAVLRNGRLVAELPPASWSVLRLQP